MNELRIGIVGAGDVARSHLEGLLRAEGVRVTALAEPVEARRTHFARSAGIDFAVADYRLVLASNDVDVVLILTPHNLHATMACEALRAGKHVICEKPMSPIVGECDRMIDTARACGRELHITHSLREVFFYRTASRRRREGALRKPLGASFRWYTDEESRLNDPAHWKGTRSGSGGGVLIDGGCHVADLANAFFGRARQVTAVASKLVARRPEVAEDTAALAIEYESGALVSVLLSFTAGSSFSGPGGFAAGMSVTLFGSDGSFDGGYMVRDGALMQWCHERNKGQPDVSHPEDNPLRWGDIDVSILRALQKKAPPPLTALDARNAVAVVDAAYQSLASGRNAEVDWRDE